MASSLRLVLGETARDLHLPGERRWALGWVGWVMGAEIDLAVEVDADDLVELLGGQRVPLLGPRPGEVEVDRPGPLVQLGVGRLHGVTGHSGRSEDVAERAATGRGCRGSSTVASLASADGGVFL